jgi:SOS response associated peptidase (SRAP)
MWRVVAVLLLQKKSPLTRADSTACGICGVVLDDVASGSPGVHAAGRSCGREGGGNQLPSFTMLTTAPGPDVAPCHNRQVVVLPPEDWSAWIHLTKTEAGLLRPLHVATVREGSG